MYINKLLILILILILKFQIIFTCPTYPKPIKINQLNPILIEAYEKVEQYLDYNLKLNNVSNFIATIVYMDEIVWSKTYGNVNPIDNQSVPLTIDTNFRIASITKIFTSLMMFQLRDSGDIVSLDDNIQDYFKEFKINDINYNDLNNGPINGVVTFRELSSHTSGLPRETPCEPVYYGTVNCTENIILSKLESQYLLSKQYKQVHYSNLGFSLLGRTLGEIYKNQIIGNKYQPTIQHPQIFYEKYVEENIFKKLNMFQTTYNSSNIIQGNLGKSYYYDDNGKKQLIKDSLSGWNSPGGGIYSTARDMCGFMMFLLNGNQDLLSDITRNEYLTSLSLLTDGNQAFGLPFEMFYDNDTNIWFKGKNGLLNGYKSQLTLATPLKLGAFFVSFTNFPGDLFTREILKILIPVYELLINQENQENQLNQPISQNDLMLYKLLVGQYQDQFGTTFIIEFDDQLNLLMGYFNDTISTLYTISNFVENNNNPIYSNIKRLNLYSYINSTCSATVNGPNEELIYFNILDFQNNKICNGLDIMGFSLNKLF